jgi:hypothetical protein
LDLKSGWPTRWVGFLPSKYFLKIFFEDVAGMKNISTFADPFAEAGAETGETVAV